MPKSYDMPVALEWAIPNFVESHLDDLAANRNILTSEPIPITAPICGEVLALCPPPAPIERIPPRMSHRVSFVCNPVHGPWLLSCSWGHAGMFARLFPFRDAIGVGRGTRKRIK